MTNKITQTKKGLRSRMKALRESLPLEKRKRIDASIAANVIGSMPYRKADTLFTYLSVGAEVDTYAIIRDAWTCGKLVAIPRVVVGTRLMEWYVIENFDHLETNSFGINEPLTDATTLVNPTNFGAEALALVPAYSFDAKRFRLGYGGGFYDEFLPRFPGISMGLCRNVQLSASLLPCREGDVAVDMVMTESGIH